MVNVRQQERVYFHPIVKAWLESHRYSAYHEVRLRHGIPDFIAEKPDHTLVIECKLSIGLRTLETDIRQLKRYFDSYTTLYPNVLLKPVLAGSFFYEGTKEICTKQGIGTIEFVRDYYREYTGEVKVGVGDILEYVPDVQP